MSPVSVPSDRRFHRAHVKPVRRRRRWQRLALTAITAGLVAAAVGAGLYRLGLQVAGSRLLDVDRIDVRGNDRLSSDEVVALLAGLQGENILRTDLAARRAQLMTSPWVLDASFRRTLPSTIEVTLTERRPIGVARIKGEMHLMDAEGVLLGQYGEAHADLDLPIVDGLTLVEPTDAKPYVTAEPAAARLAGRVIADLKKNAPISDRLSQVIVTEPDNVGVILRDEPALLYVGTEDFLARIVAFLELAEGVRRTVPDIEYVDLRIKDRWVVGPAEGRRPRVVPASASGARR